MHFNFPSLAPHPIPTDLMCSDHRVLIHSCRYMSCVACRPGSCHCIFRCCVWCVRQLSYIFPLRPVCPAVHSCCAWCVRRLFGILVVAPGVSGNINSISCVENSIQSRVSRDYWTSGGVLTYFTLNKVSVPLRIYIFSFHSFLHLRGSVVESTTNTSA